MTEKKIKLNQDHIDYLDNIQNDKQFHFYPLEFWLSFEFMGLSDEQCSDVAMQYIEYKREKSNAKKDKTKDSADQQQSRK